MDVETLLMKNIFSFVQILRQANSPCVACWDKSTLLNAFKWANYCEVLCKQCQSRKFCPELAMQISCLTLYLDPPSCLHLDLQALTDASHILTKSLLQNPYCSSVLFECLFTYSLKQANSTEQQAKDRKSRHRDVQSLARVKTTFFRDDTHHMNRPTHQASHVSRLIRNHADMLSQHLQRMSQLCASVETTHADHTIANRFSRHVDRLLLMLSNAENGWDVILETLLVLTDPRAEASHNESHQSVTSVVQECVVSSTKPGNADSMSCRVWSCDAVLLARVAEISPDFCNHYLTYLTHLANRFNINYSLPGSLPAYTWKYNSTVDEMMTIDSLKQHLTTLTSSPSSSSFQHRIRDFLRGMLANATEPSVWVDICSTMKRKNILETLS